MRLDTERFRRACRGVRQKDLAPVIGINPSNMTNYLKNLNRIRLEHFLNICEYLDEDPNRFIVKE